MIRAWRYWVAVAALVLLLVAIYFAASGLPFAIFHHPPGVLYGAGPLAGLLAVALLVADVLLPIPSSMLMIANGALFGLATGMVLSMIGRAGAFAFGYWIGAKALPLAHRFIPETDLAAARSLLDRNGTVAIIVTRPVPVLSETLAIVAGLSSLPFVRSLLAASLGSIPEALVLSAAGYYAVGLDVEVYLFVGVILVAAIAWGVGRLSARPHARLSTHPAETQSKA